MLLLIPFLVRFLLPRSDLHQVDLSFEPFCLVPMMSFRARALFVNLARKHLVKFRCLPHLQNRFRAGLSHLFQLH